MTTRLRRLAPIVTAGALVAGGLAGCSSQSPPEAQPPGTVPRGTATVSIDGRDVGTYRDVSCETIGTVTTVTTGDAQTGSTAVISTDPSLLLQSASIRNLGGFTGSYGDGLGDPAHVTVADRTYQIAGTADGFATDRPSFRKSGKFSIQVAC
jgi:lipoprotein LpqH